MENGQAWRGDARGWPRVSGGGSGDGGSGGSGSGGGTEEEVEVLIKQPGHRASGVQIRRRSAVGRRREKRRRNQ